MSTSLDQFAAEKVAAFAAQDLRRSLVATDRSGGMWIDREGTRLLSFSCNDYLNLTQHPDIKEAAIAALRKYGTGAGASRLVTGNHPLYRQLEDRLARFLGTEAAAVFGSGYLANSGIVPTLAGPEDLILLDELAHGCLWAGAQLARSTALPFRHNDVAHAEALLGQHRAKHRHALVLTDAVFSQDGDMAPLADLLDLAGRFDAWLMSDDAHGIGVVGGGRGGTFVTGKDVPVPLKMGTLGKAVGSYGGFLCSSRLVVDLIRNRARTLGHTTGLPPATVAAADAAIALIERDPGLTARPLANARIFTRRLAMPDPVTPIVPLIIGAGDAAMQASRLLEKEGFFIPAIRPPAVPRGTSRLRIIFTAGHPVAEIERLADVTTKLLLPLIKQPAAQD
jgi:8-amino-7-oxononanoate synthase